MLVTETRQRIVSTALTWEGTPWQHMQRCKHAGVDCAQFIAGVGIEEGLLTVEQMRGVEYYSQQWNLHRSEEKLINTLLRLGFNTVALEDKLPGDVLVFHYGRAAAHAGIYLGENRVIHAPMRFGGVRGKVRVETLQSDVVLGRQRGSMITDSDRSLSSRIRKAFSYPGVVKTD